MVQGRKRGCPVNVSNWIIEIRERATDAYKRIWGLTGMTYSIDTETKDGSFSTDLWKEPFVTKRGAKAKLEGRRVVEAATGARDEGQELLDEYASLGACCADASLRFTDPYGHAFAADYAVTGVSTEVDEDGEKTVWELEQIGEAVPLPYVHMTGVSLTVDSDAVAGAIALAAGSAARSVGIVFAPENASNKRFRVSSSRRSVVAVSGVTENGFMITPLGQGSATVSVVTVEGRRSCEITVNVV